MESRLDSLIRRGEPRHPRASAWRGCSAFPLNATLVGHQKTLYLQQSRGKVGLVWPCDPARHFVEGTLDGGRHHGDQNWFTNAKEWTGRLVYDLLIIAQDRREWLARSASMSILVLSQRLIPVKAWLTDRLLIPDWYSGSRCVDWIGLTLQEIESIFI